MAAEQGHTSAPLTNLGLLYKDGNGVAQSFKNAIELYTMAADQGDVHAMFNLGLLLHFQGQGVDQSNEVAREWWTKAYT